MVDISVIMPCYNRSYDLYRILEAYDQQFGNETFEIIAVDDGSYDSTFNVLQSYQPKRYKLRPIRQRVNKGPAAARNLGISMAEAPLILFVGDDILPDRFFIRAHLTQHRRYPALEVAILGRVQWGEDIPVNTLMRHIDGIGAQQFSYHYFRDETEYDFRHLYTANVSLKKDFLQSLKKKFDTDFRYASFEDVELSYRLFKSGQSIIYSYHPLGYHYHYHSIWTFSERQYRAGLMACVLINKHPEIRSTIMGKRWPFYVIQWYTKAAINPHPPDNVQKLEEECLNWLSKYEWTTHELLDHIYLKVLMYYFIKGLIFGTFSINKRAKHMNIFHANQVLGEVSKQISLS